MSKVSQAFPKRVVEARAAVRRAKNALRAAERNTMTTAIMARGTCNSSQEPSAPSG